LVRRDQRAQLAIPEQQVQLGQLDRWALIQVPLVQLDQWEVPLVQLVQLAIQAELVRQGQLGPLGQLDQWARRVLKDYRG
jgi:hypothetical protein